MIGVNASKVATALKYASMSSGCLIMEYCGTMKVINRNTGDGYVRSEKQIRDFPDRIIGVYKVTSKFPEEVVKRYIEFDVRGLV